MSEKLCSICLTNPIKYTCPACEARTCSIECVKRHKKQTECTGVVDQSKFIPKKELATDPLYINRDYNFLMKLGRDIQVGKRDVKGNAKNVFKRGNNSNYNRNKRVKLDPNTDDRVDAVEQYFPNSSSTVIKRQNTMVILLPDGMSRSTSNKTGYDKKLQTFTWTIQWIFLNDKREVIKDFLSYRISESLPLIEALPFSVLTNVQEDLKKEDIKFYLSNVFKHNQKQTYIKLQNDVTIADNLEGTVVLEYPTIYISTTELEDVLTIDSAYKKDAQSSDDSDSSSDSESGSDSDTDSSSSSSEDSDDDSAEESDDEAPPEEHSSKV